MPKDETDELAREDRQYEDRQYMDIQHDLVRKEPCLAEGLITI
jgi:hypothetical protein